MLSCTQHVNHVTYLVAINKLYEAIGYEPADHTVHLPPKKLSRVGSFLSYRFSALSALYLR